MSWSLQQRQAFLKEKREKYPWQFIIDFESKVRPEEFKAAKVQIVYVPFVEHGYCVYCFETEEARSKGIAFVQKKFPGVEIEVHG